MTTGPMLDRVCPSEKRGFVQGLHGGLVEGIYGPALILFALMIDSKGVEPTLWLCAGVSFFAATVNVPLIFNPLLKDKPKNEDLTDHDKEDTPEDNTEDTMDSTCKVDLDLCQL
eukprot:14973839-Ditylum_brightwellii.AAC.1